MKQLFVIEDSLENKITYYHLASFIMLLPFDRFYSELALISLSAHCLIHITRKKLNAVVSYQNLLLASVFFLTVIGILWSADKAGAWKDAQRQLSILILPIAFSLTKLDFNKYKIKLLLVFGFTCSAIVIYLFIDAIRTVLYYDLPLKSIFSRDFVHHNFSAPIGIHATYLSMYISLSLISFVSMLLSEEKKAGRAIYIISLLILSAGLLQLASKSVLITTILFLVIGFPLFMKEKLKKIRLAVAALILFLVAMLSITNIDSFKKRYIAELKGDLTEPSLDNEILEPRIIRWKAALELFEKKPFFGFGSGSEKKLLKEKYFEEKLYNSYLNELNTHNQYLSFLLKTGLWGLFIFLLVLYNRYQAAWQSDDAVFMGFLVLISVVSFSENILDVNKGIFFYAFFLTFFSKAGNTITKKEE